MLEATPSQCSRRKMCGRDNVSPTTMRPLMRSLLLCRKGNTPNRVRGSCTSGSAHLRRLAKRDSLFSGSRGSRPSDIRSGRSEE
jgi:hypothetical protein